MTDASPHDQALMIFGRNPVAGQVKTRLGRGIGLVAAADLYRAFLLDSLDTFKSETYTTLLFLDEMPDRELSGEVRESVRIQQGDGLGARMANAIRQTLADGFKRVCIVGSDHPTLPRARVKSAFALLEDDTLVLGPTSDGGFYLIATEGLHPRVFEDVTYSSPDTLHTTIDRAREVGIEPVLLKPWYDVDTKDDLPILIDDLAKNSEIAPRTRATLRSLGLM